MTTTDDLRELYPGRFPSLLVSLCGPEEHEHNGKPCTAPGKVPKSRAWNSDAMGRWSNGADPEERLPLAIQHLEHGGNIGMVIPLGFVILDADTPEAVRWLDAALPDSPMQETARGAHFLVRVPVDANIRAAVGVELVPGINVDIRAGGRSQIVVEPSVHATGAAYCWKRSLPESLDEIPTCPPLILEAITSTDSTHESTGRGEGVPEGERNDYLFRVGAAMRGRGLTRGEILQELQTENRRQCRPPLDVAEVNAIAASVMEYVAGETNDAGETPNGEPWETPLPLTGPPPPPFPIHAIPAEDRKWIEAQAHGLQVPPDLPAVLALSVYAAAAAPRAIVEITRGYSEPLNLFTTVALPPAHRKTAVFSAAIEPLVAAEGELVEASRLGVARAHAELEALREQKAKLIKDSAKTKDPGTRVQLKTELADLAEYIAEFENDLPQFPRLVCDDVTPEALSLLLQQQGGSIALFSPEGGDLFEMARGRYSQNSRANIGVYLSGHSGDALRVDRSRREPVIVANPRLSICLTVQPDVIQGLADERQFRGRGLLARFLYSIPPSTLGGRDVRVEAVSDSINSGYADRVRSILAKPLGDRVMRLEPEAREAWILFSEELEPRLASGGDLEVMADWAGKLAGAVGRLATILQIMETANRLDPFPDVTLNAMENAITLARYFEEHARAAFALMGADDRTEAAKRILEWIARENLRQVSKRQVQQQFKGGMVKRTEDLDEMIGVLVDHGYLRRAPQEKKPGRSPELYDVCPEALQQERTG